MKQILEQLLAGRDLSEKQAADLLVGITEGGESPALVGAILSALRLKGETPAEIRGFARAMRRLARRPEIEPGLPLVDIVGTGGDGSNSLNLSTGAALLTAACGCPVVKHGNRAISSRSGSADVLEALGIRLPEDAVESAHLLAYTGFTFLFAPFFHPAMKSVSVIRNALGVRTVFNLLGPLTNPAAPPFGVVGAYSIDAARLIAGAFCGLPIRRVFVVHGAAGWDEPTPVGPFHLFDVAPGRVREHVRDPGDLGIARCLPEELKGGTATDNAHALTQVFCGQRGPARDAVALGTALALEVAGKVPDAGAGLEIASAVLDAGTASELVTRLVRSSEKTGITAGSGYG